MFSIHDRTLLAGDQARARIWITGGFMSRSVQNICLAAAVVVCGMTRLAAETPGAPGELTAIASAPGQVSLSWGASAGATSYNVYRSLELASIVSATGGWRIAPGAMRIATVNGTTHLDTGVERLVRYYYAVTAVNGDAESAPMPFGARVMTTAPADARIWGVADMHNHQFANLGFGSKLLFGESFSTGGIADALGWCDDLHGIGGSKDLLGNVLDGTVGHLVGGQPQFDGWPRWQTHTHQQVYYEWLERAFLGGVKLMVMHAVSNEALCRTSDKSLSCNDMVAVDAQIAAAKHMEQHVDWYRIAYSGAHARQIINSGRMAVVLGIEVDNLFNCGAGGDCADDDVKRELERYYAAGVRHLLPIHVFNNGFGGTAAYNNAFNYGNKLVTGRFITPRDCSVEGYRFQLKPADNALAAFLANLFFIFNPTPSGFLGDCNADGMTPLGESLIRKMMSRKMIIDIDHMSARTADRALELAESSAYPVVAGHTGFLETSVGVKKSEAQKSLAQMVRIASLGGLVAPILTQGNNKEIATFGSAVANDCSNSSKTWAQAYLYAVNRMQGGAVGLGSDFNGLGGQPGPRFGDEACPGDAPIVKQFNGVPYPFAPHGKPGVIRRSVVGERTFDYNVDGLAHVGLIPDFIQDLKVIGLTDADLEPLFNSAEAYIALWERVDAKNVYPPSIGFSGTPAANAAGWYSADVAFTISGIENPDGWSVQKLTYSTSGAQVTGVVTISGSSTTVPIATEGNTTVSASASDSAGNTATANTAVRVDKAAPTIACGTIDATWRATDASVPCTASDSLSGLADSADAAFWVATSVPEGTETPNAATGSRTVNDLAGHSTTAGPIGGNKVDKKAPAVTITAPAGDVYTLNQAVAVSYACTDGGSGVATCAGRVPSGTTFVASGVGEQPFIVNATDAVGNASVGSARYTVAFNVCLLYDPSKARRAGSTVPIRVQLCDASGANVSTPEITLIATSVSQVSTAVSGTVEDAGAANADNNFRYDATLGGYAYNLKTTGFTIGTYAIGFVASGDPTTHKVEFQVK
jgi:microsomal dipeptidase-like Zn-dependent dipeptidase